MAWLLSDTTAAETRCLDLAFAPSASLTIDTTDAEVQRAADGELLIRFGSSTRYAHLISIIPGVATAHSTTSTWRAGGGFSVRYNAEVHEAVGSGGPEAYLTGTIHDASGAPVAGFNCSTQAEQSPDPEWCLAQLATLKAEPCP